MKNINTCFDATVLPFLRLLLKKKFLTLQFCLKLQVFSWEPIICHDAVDMGWSTLCDLSIREGRLFGCSYHQSTVGVWVADTSV